jgi:hypothetical protein
MKIEGQFHIVTIHIHMYSINKINRILTSKS